MTRTYACTLVGAALLATGCSEPVLPTEPVAVPTPAQAAPTSSAGSTAGVAESTTFKTSDGSFTVVSERNQVCMVNNQFMGRPQIPIEVEGRTYYGCCEMCKGRLARDASARTATDPISKRPVDKSLAMMVKNEQGAVTYFENEANLQTYAKTGATD